MGQIICKRPIKQLDVEMSTPANDSQDLQLDNCNQRRPDRPGKENPSRPSIPHVVGVVDKTGSQTCNLYHCNGVQCRSSKPRQTDGQTDSDAYKTMVHMQRWFKKTKTCECVLKTYFDLSRIFLASSRFLDSMNSIANSSRAYGTK